MIDNVIAVATAVAVIAFIVGWIFLIGWLHTEYREKRNTTTNNMAWARADERAKIRAQVVALDHAPGCQGEVPGLCWCPINRVLAVIAGRDE